MGPTSIAIVALAVAGASMGWPLVRLAARRAAQQPLPLDTALEELVAQYAEAHPAWIRRRAAELDEFEVEVCFTVPRARKTIADALAAGGTDARMAGDNRVVEGAAHHTESPHHGAALGTEMDEAAANAALETVLGLAKERAMYPGACGFEELRVEPYLQRRPATITPLRVVLTTAAMAISGALAGWVATDPRTAVAMLVLAAAGWVVALVDHDTLFLELRTWWLGTAVALMLVAAWDPSRLLPGVIAGAVWWGVFEGTNLLYRLVRGVDGIGGGDGMIAFATAALAVAVTGSLQVALWCVLAGMGLSLLVSLPLVVARQRGGREAFALGPFLAAGWQVALALWGLGVLV